MGNPFSSSIVVAAKGLVNDPTLRILHRNIPSTHSACYMFPPANLILLPYINSSLLERNDQRSYTANLYHELRHHALSSFESTEKSTENILLKDLTNGIEDARIEICDKYILEGGKQDLTEDNIEYVEEWNNKYSDLQLKNRWGWLIKKICTDIPRYGNLIIHEELQPYWDIAEKILKDGRFEKACDMEKEGNELSLELAKEIIEKWQEKRNEEIEEEKEKNNGEKKENKNGSGNNDSKSSGLSENSDCCKDEYDPRSRSKCDNGNGKSNQESNDSSSTSSQTSIYGSNDNNNVGDDTNPGLSSERPKRKNPRKSSKHRDSNENGRRSNAQDDKQNVNGENSTCTKKESESKTETEGKFENKENPNKEELIEKDSNGRPIDIIKEYSLEKENSDFDLEERSKKVAKMGEEGDPKDFEGEWWCDKEEFKNKKSIKKNYNGNILIPYNHEDREIIAKESKSSYFEIEDKIKLKVHILQQELVRILRYSSRDKKEFCQKHGKIDESSLYKIISGSKYFKEKTLKKQDIGAAITLLLDLSGSMSGEKAILAAQIATSFGESLINIPEVSFEIRGYNSSPLINGDFVYSYQKNNKNITIRSESINHWIFKRFNEDWKNVRYRMGSCLNFGFDHNSLEGGCVGGCNCDHENLIVAAHHLWKQKEKRKLMIVLCDGIPSGYNGTYNGLLEKELHNVIKKIKKSGIDLFCYGIKNHQVEKFYEPEVEVVDSLENLNEKTISKLASYLIKTNNGRIK